MCDTSKESISAEHRPGVELAYLAREHFDGSWSGEVQSDTVKCDRHPQHRPGTVMNTHTCQTPDTPESTVGGVQSRHRHRIHLATSSPDPAELFIF